MRISDSMMNRNFVYSINSQKSEVEKLREQIATQIRVNRPSDDPRASARIMNINGQLSATDKYKSNIENSLTFLNQTSLTMQGILDEVSKIDVQLTQFQNAGVTGNEDVYSNELSLSLDSILNLANQKFEDKYIFGGTDYSSKPYDYTAGKENVIQKATSTAGKVRVKISPNIVQEINVTGAELFGTVLKYDGNLDSTAKVGDTVTNKNKVYDVDGNEYEVETEITKTAVGKYSLTYKVTDSKGNAVTDNKTKPLEISFDPVRHTVKSINGHSPKMVAVNAKGDTLSFYLDVNNLVTKEGSSSLNSNLNQKMDIFNVIAKLRDTIKAGKQPTDEMIKAVKDFHQKLLNKMSEVGAVINRLNDNKEMINNQQLSLQEVISKEQDVDVADAVSRMQYYDYLLQVSYKMSSMILPKSILDYL